MEQIKEKLRQTEAINFDDLEETGQARLDRIVEIEEQAAMFSVIL